MTLLDIPILSTAMDDYFSDIHELYYSDARFSQTQLQVFRLVLRLLLCQRRPDGFELWASILSGRRSKHFGSSAWLSTLDIVGMTGNQIRDVSKPTHNAREQKDLTAVFSKRFGAVRFFVDSTEKHTLVVYSTDKADDSKYLLSHIGAVLPRLLPWYFESSPLSDTEREFLRAVNLLYTPDSACQDVQRLGMQLYQQLSNSEVWYSRVIDRFITKRTQKELLETQKQIEEYGVKIAEYKEALATSLRRREDAIYYMSGLESQLSNSKKAVSELLDYLSKNDSIQIVSNLSSNGDLRFIVSTYLTNYDPDNWIAVRDNARSDYNSNISRYQSLFSLEDCNMLLDAIFSDEPEIRVKMCALFIHKGFSVSAETLNDRGDYGEKYNNMLPNPHLQYYRCMGNYESAVLPYAEAGNVPGAMAVCIASAGSLNIGESITFRYFVSDLFRTDGKVIELPDGSSVTPKEACEWLRSRKGDKNE